MAITVFLRWRIYIFLTKFCEKEKSYEPNNNKYCKSYQNKQINNVIKKSLGLLVNVCYLKTLWTVFCCYYYCLLWLTYSIGVLRQRRLVESDYRWLYLPGFRDYIFLETTGRLGIFFSRGVTRSDPLFRSVWQQMDWRGKGHVAKRPGS